MAWPINLSKCVMCGTKLFWSSMHTMRHVGKESIRWKQTAKHGLMSSRQCWSLHPQRHSGIPGGPQGSAQRTETCHSLLLYIVYFVLYVQQPPTYKNFNNLQHTKSAIQLEFMKDVSKCHPIGAHEGCFSRLGQQHQKSTDNAKKWWKRECRKLCIWISLSFLSTVQRLVPKKSPCCDTCRHWMVL